MKNEGIFGLTSLLFPKKDILWIGSGQEAPPAHLKSWLTKIKFAAYSEALKAMKKEDCQVVVVSAPASPDLVDEGFLKALEARPRQEKILLLEESAAPNKRLLNTCGRVVFLPEDAAKLSDILEKALVEARGDSAEVSGSRRDIEEKVARTKSLVKFVKDLTAVRDTDGLMRLLKAELKNFQRVKEPILAFARGRNELLLLFVQGSRVVEKVVPGVWQQQIRIRVNDVNDSQYLANIFGRPFGKLLTIPLQLKRKSSEDQLKVSAVLFFEHALGAEDLREFLEFIEERLQPMSIALDRLLLEQDTNEASLLWERTFDGLQDPVVIFDTDSQILRANKAFADRLHDVPAPELLGKTLRHKDRFYEVHSYEIALGAEARPTNVINHYVDVTMAHRLQKQMIQNEKMAALGHMAGHIAHELNNPLTGIRALAQILVRQTADRQTLNNDLHEVEKAAERCQIIIKNLLEFSRGDLGNQTTAVSLNDVIQRTLPLLKTLLRQFDVRYDFTTEPTDVLVEPHLMQQVVFNIIKNAAQAMGDSGTLTLMTKNQNVAGREEVVFKIQDTGSGMDPEVQSQIFDFFFTTKAADQGTGLGLSMSKSIIDRFNGTIEVRSEKDAGTEVTIVLPRSAGAKGGELI